MRFRTVLLSFFIIVMVMATIGTIGSSNQKEKNNNEDSKVQHGINESYLHKEFDRISELPYEQYKCRQKSDMLFEFIHQQDPYSQVYTVSIQHASGKYAHVFVLYEGVVFDPTSEPSLYRQTLDKYNKNLDKWQFNRQEMVYQGYSGVN